MTYLLDLTQQALHSPDSRSKFSQSKIQQLIAALTQCKIKIKKFKKESEISQYNLLAIKVRHLYLTYIQVGQKEKQTMTGVCSSIERTYACGCHSFNLLKACITNLQQQHKLFERSNQHLLHIASQECLLHSARLIGNFTIVDVTIKEISPGLYSYLKLFKQGIACNQSCTKNYKTMIITVQLAKPHFILSTPIILLDVPST